MMTLQDQADFYNKIDALEKRLQELTARVNSLEYAGMRYGSPGFTPGTLPQPWPAQVPVTCQEQPTMGYAQ